MKKADRKVLKQNKKIFKAQIKESLIKTLNQDVAALTSLTRKLDKEIIKGSEKLAKKIARFVKPVSTEANDNSKSDVSKKDKGKNKEEKAAADTANH